MQPLTVPPRNHLSSAAVAALVVDAPAMIVGKGAELLDLNLTVLDDISTDLAAGSITRNSYAELHGSARLSLSAELDWGQAIIRPYITLSDGRTLARFNLGAYFAANDESTIGVEPTQFEVTGYDILDVLNTPVGEAYAVPKGANYLVTVETILRDQGVTQYMIDWTRSDAVLPSARVWEMDERTTWLTVVNGLLDAIGYAGVWSDWDGRLRAQPYVSPGARLAEWTYDVDPATAIVAAQATVRRDLYRAPNRWVAYRSNNVDGPAPVEGNGIYTYVNETAGPTSVQARGGRVITRPVPIEAADHLALMRAAQKVIDADMRINATVTVRTSPNPLHWHMDRIAWTDPAAGPLLGMPGGPAELLAASWTLPLDGGDMTHEWSPVRRELRTGPATGGSPG
ncbi:hypothetical protein [Micromonospora globbae]|uniref:hypothetical protein n=1 Tax=Micromonospora globbae TaxID=1894969 RepID=UPI00341E86D2